MRPSQRKKGKGNALDEGIGETAISPISGERCDREIHWHPQINSSFGLRGPGRRG